MSVTVVCPKCHHGFKADGELPPMCPDCHQEIIWITAEVEPPPYELNSNDRKFLRSIRVQAEPE